MQTMMLILGAPLSLASQPHQQRQSSDQEKIPVEESMPSPALSPGGHYHHPLLWRSKDLYLPTPISGIIGKGSHVNVGFDIFLPRHVIVMGLSEPWETWSARVT